MLRETHLLDTDAYTGPASEGENDPLNVLIIIDGIGRRIETWAKPQQARAFGEALIEAADLAERDRAPQ